MSGGFSVALMTAPDFAPGSPASIREYFYLWSCLHILDHSTL